jgi:hypothetical protein
VWETDPSAYSIVWMPCSRCYKLNLNSTFEVDLVSIGNYGQNLYNGLIFMSLQIQIDFNKLFFVLSNVINLLIIP